MIPENEIKNLVQDFSNTSRHKTFAEFIAQIFEGKFVEIYLGDSYEEISTEQISTAYPAVFCGKVIAAFKECLIINSMYADEVSKSPKLGNMLFINERAIRALTEIDGEGVIEDIFLNSKDTKIIKREFLNK